jgi:hypothetical protein
VAVILEPHNRTHHSYLQLDAMLHYVVQTRTSSKYSANYLHSVCVCARVWLTIQTAAEYCTQQMR